MVDERGGDARRAMAPAADPPSADPPLVDARLVGVRLGIDVGTVRVGVAASDPEGRLAFPVATVARGPQAAGEVARLASERGAVVVFVGLPLSFAGREGPSAIDARAFAVEVAERTGLVVRLIDERLSTVSAARALRAAGMSARRQRSVVDQQAAVVILGNALDTEKAGTTESVTEVVTHKGSHD